MSNAYIARWTFLESNQVSFAYQTNASFPEMLKVLASGLAAYEAHLFQYPRTGRGTWNQTYKLSTSPIVPVA